MKIKHTEDVNKLRAAEYPSLAEFADAYYWEKRGDETKMLQWLMKCDAVKEKFPKQPK